MLKLNRRLRTKGKKRNCCRPHSSCQPPSQKKDFPPHSGCKSLNKSSRKKTPSNSPGISITPSPSFPEKNQSPAVVVYITVLPPFIFSQNLLKRCPEFVVVFSTEFKEMLHYDTYPFKNGEDLLFVIFRCI
ncbi:hypothetical protein XENORESO_010374 [Xenotaenia resolanae]|uniref:Uncharacterized protein n=1 Tax=Xenotaenia resolanae TaxID=208358 RepID=A0ABV0WWF6_9TELE